jgi:pimeloyl-ACP methyl ester carboxylesterase
MAAEGVVLVHGGTHTSRCWEYLLPLLDAPARAVDLPGRGGRPADLSSVTLADCVAAVIDEANAAGFTRFALVGHSLGGVTITETAYLHPGRVSHLVYVGALVPPPGSSASILMTGGQLEAMTPMTEDRAKALFGNDLTEEQWAHHFASIVPDAVGIMNAQLSGYPSGIPITYVNMSQDVPVPPALAQEMAANLGSGVERRTIDAGHTVMVSQPKQLAAIINEVSDQPRDS